MKVYEHIAREQSRLIYLLDHNMEMALEVKEALKTYVKKVMPSGSGFDCGTKINLDREDKTQIVFETSFHHMDEHGGYDGWTEHIVRVRPCLMFGFSLTVSGRNRNNIKEMIGEQFQYILTQDHVL